MSEPYIETAVKIVDDFAAERLTVDEAQAELQSILRRYAHRASDDAYDAIDLAENELEEVLHARVLADQRSQALVQLQDLRVRLTEQVLATKPA